jgi:hypothetical protein
MNRFVAISGFTGNNAFSLTRQAMYVERNIEERPRNHSCRGKAISITYCEGVFVALVIQHVKRCAVLYCHLWPVWLYHIFCTFPHKRNDFRERSYFDET